MVKTRRMCPTHWTWKCQTKRGLTVTLIAVIGRGVLVRDVPSFKFLEACCILQICVKNLCDKYVNRTPK